MGIFDTGVAINHPHFKHIAERTDWTSDDVLDDTDCTEEEVERTFGVAVSRVHSSIPSLIASEIRLNKP